MINWSIYHSFATQVIPDLTCGARIKPETISFCLINYWTWCPAETQDALTHTWEQHLLHQFLVSTCLSWLNCCDKLHPPGEGSFPQHGGGRGANDGFLSWYPAQGVWRRRMRRMEGLWLKACMIVCVCVRQHNVRLIGQCAFMAPLIG